MAGDYKSLLKESVQRARSQADVAGEFRWGGPLCGAEVR